MTAPALAWARTVCCAGVGLALGLYMDVLRPVRGKIPVLFQLLVSLGLIAGWCVCGFGICGGDIRFGYTTGIWAGWLLWKKTVSPASTLLFGKIWTFLSRIFRVITGPFRIIKKKFRKLKNFSLHPGKNGLQ